MFGGSSSTEYDEIVAKTTDENLTSENWELIMNLIDKVEDDGQEGAHAVIAAIMKRLAHRNPNVQLYALSLSEALGKNLGLEIHREISSRAFTQGLEKLITDRNTHDKVRKRALKLIAEWAAEFENDESLGLMEDCYTSLKAKNYKFEQPQEPPPPSIDDEIRRKEEEELQRVLEMSKQDLGHGRWTEFSLASSTDAGPSGSGSSRVGRSSSSSPGARPSSPPAGYTAPKYQGGYVPARSPSPDQVAADQRQQQLEYQQKLQAQQFQQAKEQQAKEQQAKEQQAKEQQAKEQQAREQQAREQAAALSTSSPVTTPTATSVVPAAGSVTTSTSPAPNVNIVTRVRALYTFEPTEPGELAFEKGDILKVVDRGYKDWWRGQLKGRTGIFPVNYVEPMPEPTAVEMGKEAEQEAAVFAQAVNVQKLLDMLRSFDPTSDNLADNEEIQELYRSSMALRPKIVKLIDKYSQKRADLVSMNETFLRARTIFDRMMEESLARHTGVYDQPYRPPSQYGPILQGRPGSTMGGPQPFQWGPNYDQHNYDQHNYDQHPQQPPPQQPGYSGYPGGPAPSFPVGPQSQPLSTPTPVPGQLPAGAGYGSIPPQQGPVPPQGPPSQQGPVPLSQQSQSLPGLATPAGYNAIPVGGYAGHQSSPPYSQQGPTPYPVQSQQQPPQQSQQPQNQPQQPQHQPQQPQHQPQQPQHQPQHLYHQPLSQPTQPYQSPVQAEQQPQVVQLSQQPVQQPVQQPIQQAHPQPVQSEPVAQHQLQTQFQPQPAASVVSPQTQLEPQPRPEAQPEVQPHPIPHQQLEIQPGPILQQQPHPKPAQPISGPPPYPYDPSYSYADTNAQLWASYYAQGGTDLTGSVYFISIPGVKEEPPNFAPPTQPQQLQAGYDFSQERPEEEGLPYQIQLQPQLQPFVAHEESHQSRPVSDVTDSPYGGIGGAPAPAPEPAALPNMPRYQLSDNPVPAAQPQPQPQANEGYRPGLAQTVSSDSGHAAQPSSPPKSLFSTLTAPLNVKRAQTPPQASATPSWVLPKKTNPPGFGTAQTNGSSPTDGPHYQAVRSE